MNDRVKQMLNLVQAEYGPKNSGRRSRRAKKRSHQLAEIYEAPAADAHPVSSVKFAYQSPRQPDVWQRPTHDSDWQEVEGRAKMSRLDPVSVAMQAFHDAQRSGGQAQNAHSNLREITDHPQAEAVRPMPSRRRKSKLRAPKANIDLSGDPDVGKLVSTKRKGSWIRALRKKRD